MRILFLCADFVWPPNGGGRVRTLSQLRVLSSLPEVDEVRLFTLSEDHVDRALRDELARELPKVGALDPVFHPIHLFRHARYVPRVAWLRAARGVPYLAAKWESRSVRAALERELGRARFDVVWLASLGLARYLDVVRRRQPHARIVLDGHNVESDIWRQFARRQSGVRRRLAETEWRLALRFERDALRAVDAVAAISDDDARAYHELASVHATYVPQVVPFTPPRGTPVRAPRICYVGTLSWRPNLRGLDWFCAEVWPQVRDRLPDATLEIAGSGLPRDGGGAPLVPAAWRVPGVTVLGYVADLAPLYERSVALVAPHLEGTGVRMKLLEAFGHGVPVVTTPAGAAGLPIEKGREAVVEAEPRAFASAVVSVATDVERARLLRDGAHAFLERHHGLGTAQTAVRVLLGRAEAPAAAPAA